MKMKRTILFLAICISCLLFGCMGHSPGEGDAAAGGMGKTPVIVDTDMGFDDWMAILYLLNNDAIEIKAFTVDCQGETYCPEGAVNLTKLLALAERPEIPVFCGEKRQKSSPYEFPKMIRDGATSMKVPSFNDIEGASDYADGAVAHMESLVVKAGKEGAPLTILSIGSSTNIARAIRLAQNNAEPGYFETFKKGIHMIYKGGGAVGKAKNGALTNTDIPGNLSIPTIYSTKNKTAAWNIFVDAPGAEIIFTSGLPVTLVPVNLSDLVPITESNYDKLARSARTQSAKFVVSDIKINVKVQGGWKKVKLDYWDPSVVVAALNPGFITEKFTDVPVCVDLNPGDEYATIFIDAPAESAASRTTTKCKEIGGRVGTIDVYTKMNADEFFQDFSKTLNKE